MNRLYSINSPNGIGFKCKDLLQLEKKTDDYFQFNIDDDDDWHNYIFETNPGICCNCNKNLSINNEDNDDYALKFKVKYKLLYPSESLFIFTCRKGNEYWNVYYHYCTKCLNYGLYNWSVNNPDNKYPYLRFHGGSFIKSINNVNFNQNIPKKNYPRIYRCDYYLSSGYNYLEDDTIELSCDNRLKFRNKLIKYELYDIFS